MSTSCEVDVCAACKLCIYIYTHMCVRVCVCVCVFVVCAQRRIISFTDLVRFHMFPSLLAGSGATRFCTRLGPRKNQLIFFSTAPVTI